MREERGAQINRLRRSRRNREEGSEGVSGETDGENRQTELEGEKEWESDRSVFGISMTLPPSFFFFLLPSIHISLFFFVAFSPFASLSPGDGTALVKLLY